MKRCLCVLIAMLVFLLGFALADGAETFGVLTGLDTAQRLLDGGAVIESVYYTDGYGFSTSEFSTADANDITLLWEALKAISLGEKVNEDVSDWYPQIVFRFSDGTLFRVCFDAHWLEIGRDHYELENDDVFWHLTSQMVAQYKWSEPVEEKPRYSYSSDAAIVVNDTVVTPEELERAMTLHQIKAALTCAGYGYGIDITDALNIIDALDKELFDIEMKIVTLECEEAMGVEPLTEEEQAQARESAHELWLTYRATVAGENAAYLPAGDYLRLEGDPEGNVTRYLAGYGLTEETLYEDACYWRQEQKLMEIVLADFENSDEDEALFYYVDWLSEHYDEAYIYEDPIAIAEVCLQIALLP